MGKIDIKDDNYIDKKTGFLLLGKSIHSLLDMHRFFWNEQTREIADDEKGNKGYCVIGPDRKICSLNGEPINVSFVKMVKTTLRKNKYLSISKKNGDECLSYKIIHPLRLSNLILGDTYPDNDIRYILARNIRGDYFQAFSDYSKRCLVLLCNTVNNEIVRQGKVKFKSELLPVLYNSIRNEDEKELIIRFFIESSLFVNYIKPAYETGLINIRASKFDAEYLISNMYGLSTEIGGIDEIFGGGGPILPEFAPNRQNINYIAARMLLIVGRYGTGKSMFALQLAVEVAKKGGISMILAFEQNASEYKYAIQSMELSNDHLFKVITDCSEAIKILSTEDGSCYKNNNDEMGYLIILSEYTESYTTFLNEIVDRAKFPDKFKLRLLVADPINSIPRSAEEKNNSEKLRFISVKRLNDARLLGTNTILVAEEDSNVPGLEFEKNIADVVIRLSINSRHNYARRYLEVEKSRHQREQRGEHAFSIIPGKGVNVFPSTASFIGRTRLRRLEEPTSIEFGYEPFDRIIGRDSLSRGDVIVFSGKAGSYKTQLGLLFLLCNDDVQGEENPKFKKREKKRSLFISVRDNEVTVNNLINKVKLYQSNKGSNERRIDIITINKGFASPGYVIQNIERKIKEAILNGYSYNRVMVDNIAHWDLSCPFIRDDDTFPDALVDLLRRNRLTSLLVCGEEDVNSKSNLQNIVIDNADCLITFSPFVFRGIRRNIIRILKTRGMKHSREAFEIVPLEKKLEIKANSSLLRIKGANQVEPVQIRLFLHAESKMQNTYNHSIRKAIESVLSSKVEMNMQERVYINRAMTLSPYSAIDELQIMQMDEFQVRMAIDTQENNLILYRFNKSDWTEEWDDIYDDYLNMIRIQKDNSFYAIPFFSNLSFLAYRSDVDTQILESWETIEKAALEYKDKNNPLFDFPRGSFENYTCFFLEILLSMRKPSKFDKKKNVCPMVDWLLSKEAINAARIFRNLARLSKKQNVNEALEYISSENKNQINQSYKVQIESKIWRHWYTTLNQMLLDFEKEKNSIKIRPLPGDVSITGEWYLGLPAYTAAPDVGLNMIKLITSPESELDRMRIGVGLPTRKKFYERYKKERLKDESVSPFFKFDLKKLNTLFLNSFRRSEFGCYMSVSNIISFHLRQIIEIPDGRSVENKIKQHLKEITTRIKYVIGEQYCTNCRYLIRSKIDK